MTLSVGDTVAGRFEVREQVGTGGFSVVWRAYDREYDRDVALKCPDLGVHDTDEVYGRFEREVETLGRFAGAITPSGVVRFVDEDIRSDPRYIALEFLPGDELSEILGTGTLGSGVRRRIVIDLAETLDFLHRNGVVYLDLKPENVVLRERSRRPVLIDFNTAVDARDDVGTLFEPDHYKPPELLPETGDPARAGPHSDVYSWGKFAFYLLTGAKVPTEHVPDRGVDPINFGASCSRELAEVIRTATVPDPGERYGDGPALRDAVAEATRRGPRALLSHLDTGVNCSITDGHTAGRLVGDARVPWVVLPDPQQHVSPEHVRFEHSPAGWIVEDTSINGTYVGDHDDWTWVLSEEGATQHPDVDAEDPPPSATVVPRTAMVAPVHPDYGIELRLTVPDPE